MESMSLFIQELKKLGVPEDQIKMALINSALICCDELFTDLQKISSDIE